MGALLFEFSCNEQSRSIKGRHIFRDTFSSIMYPRHGAKLIVSYDTDLSALPYGTEQLYPEFALNQ